MPRRNDKLLVSFGGVNVGESTTFDVLGMCVFVGHNIYPESGKTVYYNLHSAEITRVCEQESLNFAWKSSTASSERLRSWSRLNENIFGIVINV